MNEFSKERTLIIIKPDGIQRTLIGEIIQRYERMGLKLIGAKFMLPTATHVEEHYSLDPNWKMGVGTKTIAGYKKQGLTPPSEDPMVIGETILDQLKSYLTMGPVLVMAWQGAHAVEVVRKVTGGTEPRSSDVGSIRGDYVLDSYQMADAGKRAIRNLVHASGSVEEAEKEIPHWFKKEELIDYRLVQEQILYDVNIDGIGE